jgi:hypothetical protein
MDAKLFEIVWAFHPDNRFQTRINPWNGTPKAYPAATGKRAISIEVFYALIRGSVYSHVAGLVCRQIWRKNDLILASVIAALGRLKTGSEARQIEPRICRMR